MFDADIIQSEMRDYYQISIVPGTPPAGITF